MRCPGRMARLACMVLAGTLALTACRAAGDDEEKALDERALKVIREMCAYYRGMQSAEGKINTSISHEIDGRKQTDDMKIALAFRRPGRMRISIADPQPAVDLVADGRKTYFYIHQVNKYVVHDGAKNLAELATSPTIMQLAGATGGGLFIVHLLRENPYEAVMEGVLTAAHRGFEKVGETRCHHLAFTQEDFAWEIWVAEGDKPLVMKVVTNQSASLNANREATIKMSSTSLVVAWREKPELEPDAFAFVPPTGAELVETFMEEPQEPLLGKPAPDFEAALLNGGKMRLSEHKGKHIVILDFWATWCPPCRFTMPILDALAKDYADKGVVLYGINQGEDEKIIKAFLKKTGLSLTVALDPTGTISGQYAAARIPLIVIVSKDGTVQVVHTGFSPTLKTLLPKQLDALLADRNLAPEAAEGNDPE